MNELTATPIRQFTGQYAFLSNFYPCKFMWMEVVWPSSEAAYQGAKVGSDDLRMEEFSKMSPGKAKREGGKLVLFDNWEQDKVRIMRDILLCKFHQNPDLAQALVATDPSLLEEGNNWNDRFWGVCPIGSGNGQNMLGRLLMTIRQSL